MFKKLVPLALAIASTVPAVAEEKINWLTGQGVSLGGIYFPFIHAQGTWGTSTADPGELAVGHHDPNRQGYTPQGFEFGLAANFGENVSLFGVYAAVLDTNNRWSDEFEEYYALIRNLPLGARLKGGKFYVPFGAQNTLHTHEFDFVDQNLVQGRTFGDDSLTMYGAALELPVLRFLPVGWEDKLSLAWGIAPGREEHDHGGGEEEEEGHEHGGHTEGFEAEHAGFADAFFTASYAVSWAPRSDTRWTLGASAAFGRNDFGNSTQIFGGHLEYLWAPSGTLECGCCTPSGQFFRWRTEVIGRRISASAVDVEEVESEEEHHTVTTSHRKLIGQRFSNGVIVPVHATEEHEEEVHADEHETRTVRHSRHADLSDWGLATSVSYGFPGGKWRAHLRGEYVSGESELSQQERWRVSPAVSWSPSRELPLKFTVQYNFDHLEQTGEEHSVWAQFSLSWGDKRTHVH